MKYNTKLRNKRLSEKDLIKMDVELRDLLSKYPLNNKYYSIRGGIRSRLRVIGNRRGAIKVAEFDKTKKGALHGLGLQTGGPSRDPALLSLVPRQGPAHPGRHNTSAWTHAIARELAVITAQLEKRLNTPELQHWRTQLNKALKEAADPGQKADIQSLLANVNRRIRAAS